MILKGAGGGSSTFVGGSGAFVSGNLAVTPFETLTILVGGGGGGFFSGGTGGSGGGGNGTTVDAGGGGLSAISLNGAEVADAGGGGGSPFTFNLTSVFVSTGGGGLFRVTNNNGENGSVTLTFASAAPILEASTLFSFGLLTLGGVALTVYKWSRARI